MDSLVSFSNVALYRNNRTIFSGLSFTILNNSHVLLYGNAYNARIVLEMMAGIIQPGAGQIVYPAFEALIEQGKVQNPLFSKNNLIALVNAKPDFRNLSQRPDLYYQQRFNSADDENSPTVKAYLSVFAGGHGADDFEKILEQFGLTDIAERELIKLSSGETRRLQLAAAMIRKPVLLLLDNPMTGLDTENRNHLEELFLEIIAQGVSIVQTVDSPALPSSATDMLIFDETGLREMLKAPFSKPLLSPDTGRQKTVTSGYKDELQKLFPKIDVPAFSVLVRMRQVTISYGDKKILSGVNWEVKPGERWRIKGRNGAGKSTLLSLINADNPQAFAQDIILFDRKKGSGESIWDIKANTGFFSPELFRYFPVEQNCLQVIESGYYDTSGLFRRSDPAKERMAASFLAYFGMADYGQRAFAICPEPVQRISLICRALIKLPALLLLDEPCQGLDAFLQGKLFALLNFLCQNPVVSLIYISHYDHEVPECVTKELVLEEGKIISLKDRSGNFDRQIS